MTLHNTPPLIAGADLPEARAAMVMVHGRGASAASILTLADAFNCREVAYLAPQASGHTWYPLSFLVPVEENEPSLTAALDAVDRSCQHAVNSGLPWDRIMLLGFSQGACLATEFAARNARRYAGVIALSGGLIGTGKRETPGPPPDDKAFDYDGTLDGTPFFIGCSDRDPHIPLKRVRDTAEVMRSLGAGVTERIYEGMGHTINEDEVAFVRDLLRTLVTQPS